MFDLNLLLLALGYLAQAYSQWLAPLLPWRPHETCIGFLVLWAWAWSAVYTVSPEATPAWAIGTASILLLCLMIMAAAEVLSRTRKLIPSRTG